MKVVLTQLPEMVTPDIERACRSTGLQGSPVFVRLQPAPDAVANRCIHNVQRTAEQGCGELVLGWKIYVWPRVLVQLIGHAVLRSREQLVCITPDRHGDQQVLFVADPSIQFDASDPMARMPSLQVALDPHADVTNFISVEEQIHALKAKYPPWSESLLLRGADAVLLKRLQAMRLRLIREIALRTRKPNERCVCDSGRKFRKCCQDEMLRARQTEV